MKCYENNDENLKIKKKEKIKPVTKPKSKRLQALAEKNNCSEINDEKVPEDDKKELE